jgi:hypothetical protein
VQPVIVRRITSLSIIIMAAVAIVDDSLFEEVLGGK